MTNHIDPADFMGHLVDLYDVRIKNGRIRVVLDLPMNRELLVQMAEHEHSRIFAGFGFMQPQLPLAMPDEPPAPKMADDKSHLVTKSGESVLPHKFRPDFVDGQSCLFCKMPEAHEIHEGVISSRPTTPDEDDALKALNDKAASDSVVAAAEQLEKMGATV